VLGVRLIATLLVLLLWDRADARAVVDRDNSLGQLFHDLEEGVPAPVGLIVSKMNPLRVGSDQHDPPSALDDLNIA